MDIIACRHGESKVHHILGNAFFGGVGEESEGVVSTSPRVVSLKKKKERDKILVEITFLETVFLRFYDLLLTFYCM